jgi:hypothetical protein
MEAMIKVSFVWLMAMELLLMVSVIFSLSTNTLIVLGINAVIAAMFTIGSMIMRKF